MIIQRGRLRKALMMLNQGGKPHKTSKKLNQRGRPCKTSKTLNQRGRPRKALKILNQRGRPCKTSKMLKQRGRPRETSEILNPKGGLHKILKMLSKRGRAHKTSSLLDQKGKSNKTSKILNQRESSSKILEMLNRRGRGICLHLLNEAMRRKKLKDNPKTQKVAQKDWLERMLKFKRHSPKFKIPRSETPKNSADADRKKQLEASIMREVQTNVRFPQKRINVAERKKHLAELKETTDFKRLSPKPTNLMQYIRKNFKKVQKQFKELQDPFTSEYSPQFMEMMTKEINEHGMGLQHGVLVRKLQEVQLEPLMTLTLSDDYGNHNTTVFVKSFISAKDALIQALKSLRSPVQLLPYTYYHIYQVLSPVCVREMAPDEKILESQVRGVQKYTYLVRRERMLYKVDEDVDFNYCQELLGQDKQLLVCRYREIKEGRLRVLRVKIKNTWQMLQLSDMQKRMEQIKNIDQKLVAQFLAMGSSSDLLAELEKWVELGELQEEQYEDAGCRYYVKRPPVDWEGKRQVKQPPRRCKLYFCNVTSYIMDNFGEREYHWYPDYGYMQRLYQYSFNKVSEVMSVLQKELHEMDTQYQNLLATPPETLYAEDELMLLNCKYEEEVKEQESKEKHEEFLKTLEYYVNKTNKTYFSSVQGMRAAWDLYQYVLFNFQNNLFILDTYVKDIIKYESLIKWHRLNGRTSLIQSSQIKILRLEEMMCRAVDCTLKQLKIAEVLKQTQILEPEKEVEKLSLESIEVAQDIQQYRTYDFVSNISQKKMAHAQGRAITLKMDSKLKYDDEKHIKANINKTTVNKCIQERSVIFTVEKNLARTYDCQLKEDKIDRICGTVLRSESAVVQKNTEVKSLSTTSGDVSSSSRSEGSIILDGKMAVNCEKSISDVLARDVLTETKPKSSAVVRNPSFKNALKNILAKQRKHIFEHIHELQERETLMWKKILMRAYYVRRKEDHSDEELEGLQKRVEWYREGLITKALAALKHKQPQKVKNVIRLQIDKQMENHIFERSVWKMLRENCKYDDAHRYNVKKFVKDNRKLIKRFIKERNIDMNPIKNKKKNGTKNKNDIKKKGNKTRNVKKNNETRNVKKNNETRNVKKNNETRNVKKNNKTRNAKKNNETRNVKKNNETRNVKKNNKTRNVKARNKKCNNKQNIKAMNLKTKKKGNKRKKNKAKSGGKIGILNLRGMATGFARFVMI